MNLQSGLSRKRMPGPPTEWGVNHFKGLGTVTAGNHLTSHHPKAKWVHALVKWPLEFFYILIYFYIVATLIFWIMECKVFCKGTWIPEHNWCTAMDTPPHPICSALFWHGKLFLLSTSEIWPFPAVKRKHTKFKAKEGFREGWRENVAPLEPQMTPCPQCSVTRVKPFPLSWTMQVYLSGKGPHQLHILTSVLPDFLHYV